MKQKLFCLALVVLISSALFCLLCGCEAIQYKQALDFFEAEQYEDALNIFVELGNYKEAVSKMTECRYEVALSAFDQGQYENAILLFTQTGNYKDSFTKIDECKYYLAKTAAESKDWETAIDLLDSVNYEDSQILLENYEREQGMSTHADNNFLSDIEQSVLTRMESSSYEDHYTLVNTELAYLDKYGEATFYDENLKSIADLYLEGLHKQKEALDYQYFEYQLAWQEGLVLRFSALSSLYDNYGFLEDNPSFVAEYIMELDENQKLLDGYNIIEADLESQLSSLEYWDYDDISLYNVLHNGTEYSYTIYWYFTFGDTNGIQIGTDIAVVENVEPNSDYLIEVWPSCGVENVYTISCDIELYDIYIE